MYWKRGGPVGVDGDEGIRDSRDFQYRLSLAILTGEMSRGLSKGS